MGIEYKFQEDLLLKELKEYIDNTYSEHYSEDNKIQTTEYIMDQCDTPDFFRGNILKYAARYGRKEGYNRKDILKTLHYAIMMLSYHDSRFSKNKKVSENVPERILPRKVELVDNVIRSSDGSLTVSSEWLHGLDQKL